MKRLFTILSLGLLLSSALTLLIYGGIFLNIRFWPWPTLFLLTIGLLPAAARLIAVWNLLIATRLPDPFRDCMAPPETFAMFAAFFGTLCLVWALPALVIYWGLNPASPKKAIKICALFLSIGTSLLYFRANRERFPTVADRITYFTGVIFGPVSILEILL